MASKTRSVFVDANVVVEILLNRRRRDLCEKLLSDPSVVFYFSTLSVHLTYHFSELDDVDPRVVGVVVDQLNILPVSPSDVKLAQGRYTGKEFEDCLQAACAEANQCEEILTLDKKFAKVSGTTLPVHVVR